MRTVRLKNHCFSTFVGSKITCCGFCKKNYCIWMSVSMFESPFSQLKAFFYFFLFEWFKILSLGFAVRIRIKNEMKRFALLRKLYSLKRSFFWVKIIVWILIIMKKNVGKLRYLHSTIRKI